MNSVDGLPAFTVKVILSEPPAEMQQRVQAKKLSDQADFDNFISAQSAFEDDNNLNDNGFSVLPYEPVVFVDRKYLLVTASVVDGPQQFNSYVFKYPIKLTSLDFTSKAYIVPDLGLVPNLGSPFIRATEYALDALKDLMITKTILRYVAIVSVFQNGKEISTQEFNVDQETPF